MDSSSDVYTGIDMTNCSYGVEVRNNAKLMLSHFNCDTNRYYAMRISEQSDVYISSGNMTVDGGQPVFEVIDQSRLDIRYSEKIAFASDDASAHGLITLDSNSQLHVRSTFDNAGSSKYAVNARGNSNVMFKTWKFDDCNKIFVAQEGSKAVFSYDCSSDNDTKDIKLYGFSTAVLNGTGFQANVTHDQFNTQGICIS